VNDVPVGKVTDVKLQPGGWDALVTVKVRGDIHLAGNAVAAVKQTSLLGEKYVELADPDQTPNGTLHNGDTIPINRTGSAPDVEEVLGALALLLNEGGLAQIQTISRELNNALTGHESQVRDLLSQMNSFVGTLDQEKDKITTALVQIDRLAKTLNEQKTSLTAALDTFPGALKVLSDDRTRFTTLLEDLANLGATTSSILTASTSVVGNTVSKALSVALTDLEPVLEQLTAAGQNLPRALKYLLTFPFPVGKATEFLRSDYANLALHLDMDLNDNLCGLGVKGLCDLINALVPQKPITSTTSPIPKSFFPKGSSGSQANQPKAGKPTLTLPDLITGGG
jgi:phospholipid/cholesterol/gamma-HCH transport system substrate-binding protein